MMVEVSTLEANVGDVIGRTGVHKEHKTMQRRKFLIGMGSLAAGSAAAMGTGAFNFANVERGISVNVADDSDAFLSLSTNSEYANTNNGTLELTFDSDAGVSGQGVNAGSDYSFRNVFTITNNGSGAVDVWIVDFQSGETVDATASPDEPVQWYDDSGSGFGNLMEGSGNSVSLGTGDSINVNCTILLRENSSSELPDQINIYADAN